MKKFIYSLCTITALILLTSCGAKEDLTDYIDVSFSGMDSQGTANYEIESEELLKEIFDYDEETNFVDEETELEIKKLDGAYKIKVDPEEDLSNGDKVKIIASVDDEKTDKIKGGEKEVTVEDLEEPDVLTSKDVEENLVLNFNGASGNGEAMIDNKFDDSLGELSFEIEGDGELENGEKAKAVLDEDEIEGTLNNAGYVLEEDFNPTFEVEGLDIVAEEASDIENLKDIERMIKEEVGDTYKDRDEEYSFGSIYDIDKKAMMYRPFDQDSDNEEELFMEDEGKQNGSLVGVYHITQYSGGDEKEKEKEFTAVIGFTNIILDDDDKANVSDMEQLTDEKDEKYSAESVIQIYEGDGYKKVDD